MGTLATEAPDRQLVVLAGVVGSGKSTLSSAWERLVPGWVRVNQDDLGDRRTCEQAVRAALRAGKSVLVDRQNFDAGQRRTWLEIASEFPNVQVGGMVMGTSKEECRQRLLVRQDHPTIDNPQLAVELLDKFSGLWQEPQLSEGFDRLITLPSLPAPAELTAPLILSLLETLAASPPNPSARAQRQPHPRPTPGSGLYARPGSNGGGFTDDGTWRPPPSRQAYPAPPPQQQPPLVWGTPAPSAPGGAWAGRGWAPPAAGMGGAAGGHGYGYGAPGQHWGGPPSPPGQGGWHAGPAPYAQAHMQAPSAAQGYGAGGYGGPGGPGPAGAGAGAWAPPPPSTGGPYSSQLNGPTQGGTGAGGR